MVAVVDFACRQQPRHSTTHHTTARHNAPKRKCVGTTASRRFCLHAFRIFCPIDQFAVPDPSFPVLLVSACMLFAPVLMMVGLGCGCGAMPERGQTVERVVCSFVLSLLKEWQLWLWENGGTSIRREYAIDSYNDSNVFTGQQPLCSEYHVERVHDRLMDLLFGIVSVEKPPARRTCREHPRQRHKCAYT